MLRIDDTDDTRSKPEYEAAILEDLAWLGLEHQIFARQSDRRGSLPRAAERLKTAGRLYPCYETAAELDRRRKRQMAAGKPPVYDRAALTLTARTRRRLRSRGPQAALALQAQPRQGALERSDPRAGGDRHRHPVRSGADPRGRRFLYTLPSVVDDVDFAVSHILRGEDHVTNTAPQIEIFEALGAAVPRFAHFALFVARAARRCPSAWARCRCAPLREERHRSPGAERLSRQDRHLRQRRAALCRCVLGRWICLREDGPRAGAFRCGGTDGAERQDLACHALRASWRRA